ncbi:hypothetical protein OG858_46965 (plasmid) [Streptomyces europaeiscabiei]|uniref:hypothetical protein n=1 Tax=Streptomyces europaeiscabiei TaxID=146819 RepID=UPI002E818C89|nr:hypothetical protein [Streptomyces europaeiscabiei]WUD38851.1 hypothetical protein OG858_46965 [Streptomyces europaeiscabiei]
MTQFTAGQFISYDYTDGTVSTVRVTGVDRSRLTYECSDGVGEAMDASQFRTLEQQLTGYRAATAEEAARFEARYQPAPQNWN